MKDKIMKELEGTNMKVKTWKINTEFLGEDKRFETLPIGYVNKDVCGCGATSIVLRNPINAIIAVPTIALIENKVQQQKPDQPYIIGVTGATSDSDIEAKVFDQLAKDRPIKIMVTFDSLHRVEKYISYKTPGREEPTQLVIDEADQLLSIIELKAKAKAMKEDFLQMNACNSTYNIARKYKDQVTFITASNPLMALYPSWMTEELTYHKFEFLNKEVITPILYEREAPVNSLINEVIVPIINKGYVNIGKLKIEKVIVFFNNVNRTIKIIEELGIKEESGMICGDNRKKDLNKAGIRAIKDYSDLPKYTFVTSAGFQGIDIYDDKTINVVVSNATKTYQALDLDTDLKQAISRQRIKSNKNYKYYLFIYNSTKTYIDPDKESAQLEKQYNTIAQYVDEINKKIEENEPYQFLLDVASDVNLFKTLVSINDKGFYEVDDQYYKFIYARKIKNALDYAEGNIKVVKGSEAIIMDKPDDSISTLTYEYIYKIYKKSTKSDKRPEYTEAQLNSPAYKIIDTLYNATGKLYKSKQYAETKLANINIVKNKDMIEDIRNIFITNREYTRSETVRKSDRIYKIYGLNKKPSYKDLNIYGIEFEDCTKDRKRAVKITRKLRKL